MMIWTRRARLINQRSWKLTAEFIGKSVPYIALSSV